jgi:DNA polymerase III epsilon subunit-like protein
MLRGGRVPFEAISELAAFVGEMPLVAHNAFFALGFLR